MDYEQSEILSCYYDLYFGGVELDFKKKQQVQSITIKESASGADTAVITMNDLQFEFIEDAIFVEDVPVRIVGGWNEEIYRFEFWGYISAIDIQFGAEGYPIVTLTCMDATHLMNREKKKRTWENTTSAAVVKLIASEYGFKTEIESGYSFKKEESIAQSNETDISFLQGLAGSESDLFICVLKNGDTIYYGKRGILSDPVADLWYKQETREVISFNPRINRETKREKVNASDITSKDKSLDSKDIDNANAERDVQGDPVSTSSSATGGEKQTGYAFTGQTKGVWTEGQYGQ